MQPAIRNFLIFVAGVVSGYAVYSAFSARPAVVTAADVRATLHDKCIGRSDVLADIETMLPTNGRGEITAARLRSVLIEVVGKC